MSFAVIFPGQGSQSLRMMDTLKNNEIVRSVFNEAYKINGIDYLKMQDNEDASEINKTINTQPLILTASIAIYKVWTEKFKIVPKLLAGHSLGEWTSLVIANTLSFADALKLVTLRAKFMQEAVNEGVGAMAVVLGLDDELVVELCNNYSKENNTVVSGVNFNAKGQVVIAGYKQAIDGITSILKDNGAKRVQILPVSVPSHSVLMKGAANKLSEEMKQFVFNMPNINIVQNFAARYYNDINEIKESLVKQLYSPVLWHKSIDYMFNHGIRNFIECGPNKVLTGLNKRINPEINALNISNLDDIIAYNL
jgi:[acyl-carrier-protein] S-malonyltransferase